MINRALWKVWLLPICIAVVTSLGSELQAQGPTVAQALKIQPRQYGVDCDQPKEGELNSCSIDKSSKRFGMPGYVVFDGAGRVLRQFFDTNKDGSLDQWSYFKNGIEVYRDVDSNFDKRTDQYRWLGSSGTRWGLDPNQDGVIDRWKMISAEEAAEELFQSVRTGDVARFKLLLPTEQELEAMDLGGVMTDVLNENLQEAARGFERLAREQNQVGSKSKWVHFGSSRPSLIPGGQAGIGRDLVVYDHASAVFQTGDQYGQLSLGTIVRIGDAWKILELPQIMDEQSVVNNGGLFYPSESSSPMVASAADPTDNELMSNLFGQFDELETALRQAKTIEAINRLEEQRAEILMKLALSSRGEDQTNWIRQMADTVTGSFQADRFDKGLQVLASNVERLKKEGVDLEGDYSRWRIINAKFSKAVQQGNSKERSEANDTYITELEEFVGDHPSSTFAADAMLQLALYSEVSERDGAEKAVGWYMKIQENYEGTDAGRRAAGAVTRLTGQGKPLRFSGQDLKGRPFDLRKATGKIVVIHYWETWCDACIEGFDELEKLKSKYRSDLLIVGANLDSDRKQLADFLNKNREVSWIQLNSPGGVEKSPLAIQLGVTTLPLTLLIDQDGHLIESNVPVEELDREIQRLLKQSGVAAGPIQNRRK